MLSQTKCSVSSKLLSCLPHTFIHSTITTTNIIDDVMWLPFVPPLALVWQKYLHLLHTFIIQYIFLPLLPDYIAFFLSYERGLFTSTPHLFLCVCVFSERDRHTQAVEKRGASPEESHADRLPARSLQVCVPRRTASPLTSPLVFSVSLPRRDCWRCASSFIGASFLLPFFHSVFSGSRCSKWRRRRVEPWEVPTHTERRCTWWRCMIAEQKLQLFFWDF